MLYLKRFNENSNNNLSELLKNINLIFINLLDNNATVETDGNTIVFKQPLPVCSENNDIETYSKWVLDLNSIMEQINTAISYMKSEYDNIEFTFKNKNSNIEICIFFKESAIYTEATYRDKEYIIFQPEIIINKFKLPPSTNIAISYLDGPGYRRVLYITAPIKNRKSLTKNTELIEALSNIKGFLKYYETNTGILSFVYNDNNMNYMISEK